MPVELLPVLRFFQPVELTATGFCPRCDRNRTLERRKPDHVLHLVLALVTLGLWAVPWLALSLYGRRYLWQCVSCHRLVEPDTPPRPRGSRHGERAR